MKKIKMPNFNDFDFEKMRKERYEQAKTNPENMSYWFPKLKEGKRETSSSLKLPETTIVPLSYEWWEWLESDQYTDEKIAAFNDFLLPLSGLQLGQTKFMKTGIFSNKFEFESTMVRDKTAIGSQFLWMYYASMMVGANNTAEVVFREMVKDKEKSETIYKGMPLHTEFRVFYDFDAKKAVGIANYWHPDVMKENLKDENAEGYKRAKEKITTEYEAHKKSVTKEVESFMEGINGLAGKWSVDVMKNAEDYWLIDMARMEKSALVAQMEKIET